jgi:CHAT domain-containing protein
MRDVAVLAVGALFLSVTAVTAEIGSDCQDRIASTPSDRDVAECLYREAARTRSSSAASQLESLALENTDRPWFTFYLGNLKWQEAEAAQELYRIAAQQFAELADAEGEVLARGNRSQVLFHLGRLAEAGAEAEAAYRRASASDMAAVRAHGSVVLAGYLFQTGRDLQRARSLLVGARAEPELRSSPHLLKTCLTTLGNVALALGDQREARRTFSELIDLGRELREPRLGAVAHYGLTRMAVGHLAEEPSEPRRHEAIQAAFQALEAAREAGIASVEAKAHWVLGMLLPWEEARLHLGLCEQSSSDFRERSYCLNARIRRLAALDPVSASSMVREARELTEAGGDPWSAALFHEEELRVSWTTESVDRAVRRSWEALKNVEAIRDLQPDGSETQARLFTTWADDYHWFAGRLLQEARESGRLDLVPEALAVSERLRARALTDWLRATGQAPAVAGHSGFASLGDVQRALGLQEAMLAFQVAPWEDLTGDFGGGSWVIVVTRGSARAYPLPGRSEIRQAVDQYTGLFEGRDGTEAGASVAFYQQLLAPALAELPAGVDRLILVPDDALHRLPFGALRPALDAPPLAATHRLSVAPSATLWLGWRRGAAAGSVLQASAASAEASERTPALVLAAPAAPSDRGGSAAAMAETPRDPALSDLPPLRHARREGRAVKAALGGESELALGTRASEALLARPDLGRFGVLHLAAHAVTDEDHPERSAVVLAPPAAGDPDGPDGLLRAAEIASLDLGGKLVVLSSCRSAAGTVLRGEGVMSLGRAFFQAGSRTVVASLWPVRDDEAAVLFEAFYRHLAQGETVAAALQAAQAERRAAGAPASAWAAFVTLGDGDLAPVTPPPPPDPRVRLALIAAGIFAALLLAVAAIALRRRLAAALGAGRARGRDLPGLAPSSPSPR